jgi:hypothetical protein
MPLKSEVYMELFFTIKPHEGSMEVIAKYKRDDIKMPYFYLNRDVKFAMCICDGTEVNITSCFADHPMIDHYEVCKVTVPDYNNCLELHYSLVLSGETGAWPYVREKITPEFSLIRFETFCYPMFLDDWTEFRNPAFKCESVKIAVPEGYSAVTAIDAKANAGMINSAVAPYELVAYPFGEVYYLPSVPDEKRNYIEDIIGFTFNYMNAHFGSREAEKTVFAVIPAGYGSFARTDSRTIFIDEKAFDSYENLRFAVHEFIHLDWNAQCKDSVQRARFFDEAFTCYFENRVMGEYLRAKGIASHSDRGVSAAIVKIQGGEYPLIPICQYGEHECGDLSYTIGALCLDKLYDLLGEALFDGATADFLQKYRTLAADFDDFCEAYKSYCGREYHNKLTAFFDDWIYSCEGLIEHMKNCEKVS